jgi:predicted O-methyltransferase YrrM
METLLNILQTRRYRTDKHTDHHYVQDFYDPAFAPFKEKPISFLEIGVWNGESMKLWSDFFKKASYIVGIDIFTRTSIEQVQQNLAGFNTELHRLNSTQCTDEELIQFQTQYPGGFDIIIDDGDHSAEAQLTTFSRFSNLVKEGGIYIIEDIADKNVEIISNNIENVEIKVSNGEKYKSKFGVIYF